MKDALGHGSNGHSQAMSDGHPKTAPVPTHPAFGRYEPGHSYDPEVKARMRAGYSPHYLKQVDAAEKATYARTAANRAARGK